MTRTLRSALLVCACALSACATGTLNDHSLDIAGEGGAVARQFDSIETAAHGNTSNKKECRASKGGFTFYCDTYAYYCVKAGHKWDGTKVKGTCTRTHPN